MMKRVVVILLYFSALLSYISAQENAGADSLSANPFAVIEYIEHRISGNKLVNVDSIKYSLAKQYVIDYVNLGQDVAYDSLSQRAMRCMYLNYSESSPNNYGSLDDIEDEMNASEGELYRLRRENEELKQRVNRLEYDSRRNGAVSVSKEEIARTNAWVQKVLKRTNFVADSLTLVSLKGRDKIHLPLCFSTVSDIVFQPHFMDSSLSQKETIDTLALSKKLKYRLRGRDLENRLLYKTSLLNPSNIAYYNLQEYKPDDYLARHRFDKRYLDVKGVGYDDNDIYYSSAKKQKRENDIWQTKGKVSVSFITYLVSHWAGGGKNTATFSSDFRLDRNYAKDNKKWNNRLEMNLGFIYYENDKTHPFRINEDETSISSAFLLQTKKQKKLYFALPSVRMRTHLFTSYDSYNDTAAATSFLTPTNIYLGTGLYYEHNKNINASIQPIAGRIFWLINDKLKSEDHGLDADKRASIAPGLRTEVDMLWKITRGVSINNELSFFLPYTPKTFSNDIMLDWKLTGNFTVNRFFSAQLILKIIFDKHVQSEYREWPQVQQKYSLKFSYAF